MWRKGLYGLHDQSLVRGKRNADSKKTEGPLPDQQITSAASSLQDPMPETLPSFITTLAEGMECPCGCDCEPIQVVDDFNQCTDCDPGNNKDCNDVYETQKRHKGRTEDDFITPTEYDNNLYKPSRIDSYYYRFLTVVLEALRYLKECNPKCDGFHVATIVQYVWENFVGDGDVESQVLTALRLAHVSGLVVYLKDDNAYRLVTPEITNMCASSKRYQRFMRRRRNLARPDAICPRATKHSARRSKRS